MRAFHHRQHTRAVPILIGIPTAIWLGLSAAAAQTPDQVRTNSEPPAAGSVVLDPWTDGFREIMDTLRVLMSFPMMSSEPGTPPEVWMDDFCDAYEQFGTPPLGFLQLFTLRLKIDVAFTYVATAPATIDPDALARFKQTLLDISDDASRTPQP